jgi:hypothetical protein
MKVADGKLYIKFDNIYDPDNTTLSLSGYIAKAINDASNPIYQAIDTAIQNIAGQIEAAVGGISEFRNHGHDIDW